MKTKFSSYFLFVLVLVTMILPNHNLITRVKASLTLTELEISSCDDLHTMALIPELTDPLSLAPKIASLNLHFDSLFISSHKETNPTLNLLYLGHSPPTLA